MSTAGASLFAAAALAAAQPTLIDGVFSRGGGPALPARARGVLVEQSGLAGVCFIDQNHTVSERGASCAAGYGQYDFRTQDAYWVPYFLSKGEGKNFSSGWEVQPGFRADCAMFDHATPNRWGLSRKAHLVELELNGGAGAVAGNLHFIVTDAKTLDRTPAFQLDAQATLEAFLKPLGDASSPESRAIDKDLQAAVVKLQGAATCYAADSRDMQRSSRVLHGFTATWDAKSETLEAVYYRRLEDRFSSEAFERRGRGGPPRLVIRGHEYGAEYAVKVVVAKDGTLLSRTAPPSASYESTTH